MPRWEQERISLSCLMCGPLRVAFVGAGRMARLHLHALRRVRSPHVVAAVCDTSETAARGLAELAGAAAEAAILYTLEDKVKSKAYDLPSLQPSDVREG